ncbi:hypothetical protein D3C78_18920 [compost metagenome]
MHVEVQVRNRDESDKVARMLKNLLEADYKDLDDYAWRHAFVNSVKITIDRLIEPTVLEEFELSCECGKKTQSECETVCERFCTSNENGEENENGNE